MDKKFVILGAGPTGLGAAIKLKELGHKNFLILDKESYVGGLSASFQDPHGFTWDMGGHVIHSHFNYFNKVVRKNLKNEKYFHQRESWIYYAGKLIPYPFQNHIHLLPLPVFIECFFGILNRPKTTGAQNFLSFIKENFGEGIAKHFLIPFNQKMWNFSLSKISAGWLNERVSTVKLSEVTKNAIIRTKHSNWGPNSRFIYPKYGTGQLWITIAKQIDKGNIRLKNKVEKINIKDRRIYLENGSSISYDFLISSMPLDQLIQTFIQKPIWLKNQAQRLAHTSVQFIGIGIKKRLDTKKCWIYFPQKEIPFHRITFLSNYSPKLTPGSGFSSVLIESSTTQDQTPQKIIDSLLKTKILYGSDQEKITNIWTKKAEYAYPIPTLERNRALRKIQPYLERQSIFSRGRFGAWKYEIGNMDHSFMQGVEVVDRILLNKKETVWTL